MFQFLNNNNGSIIAILTFILAIITGIYAYLTWRMVKETKRMREIQSEPNISIFYRSKEEYISLIDIVIKNIGQGPAHNLKFEVNPDFKYSDEKNISELNLFKRGLKNLPPNQELVFFLNSLVAMLDKKLCLSFDMIVKYEDASGKKFKSIYNIDLSEVMGLRHVGEPPLKKIADQAEKLVNEIRKLYSHYPQMKVITYTKSEIDEENKKIKEYYENKEKERRRQEEGKS